MARLDQLNLRDNTAQIEEDERRREMFIIQAEFLLDNEKWRFAWDTITGMRDSVKAGLTPSERMWQALKNIEGAGYRVGSTRRWGRRYEGR